MPQATYPAVPSVARVDLLCSTSALSAEGPGDLMNTYYFRDTVVVRNTAYLVALAEKIEDAWTAHLRSKWSTENALEIIRVIDLNTTLRPSIDLAVGAAGTMVGAIIPYQATAQVTLLGDAGGFPKKSYIRHAGGVLESGTATNKLTPAERTSLQTAYDAFLVAASDPGVAPLASAQVIVSVYEPKASGGGTPSTKYRTAGVSNTLSGCLVEPVLRRAASRSGVG